MNTIGMSDYGIIALEVGESAKDKSKLKKNKSIMDAPNFLRVKDAGF